MVTIGEVWDVVAELPEEIRGELFSSVLEEIVEAEAEGASEDSVDQIAIKTLVEELFKNLVEPIEMIEDILKSKVLREFKGPAIGLGEVEFSMDFVEQTFRFRQDFWSLVKELQLASLFEDKEDGLSQSG